MKISHSRQSAGKALLLLWAIFCILLFIIIPGRVNYVQWSNLAGWQLLPGKLARLDPLRDIVNLLGSLAGVGVFSVACTSLGIFVAAKLKIDNIANSRTAFTSLALLATEFLIGQGLFSLIFLTLGGLYQLTPIYVILILAIGFLLGFRYVKSSLLNAFRDKRFSFNESVDRRTEKLIVWLSMSILLSSLLYSTARISYDASAVYFSNAKLTAMTQQIDFFKDDSFVVSAFQTTIQYTALIQIFGDQSARLFSWVCGLTVIIFSLTLGERLGISRKAKLILLTLLLTSTAFLDLMGDGKVDLISCAPAIAAVYWMVVEAQNKTPSTALLLLTGLLIGLAIVARPFNAFLLGIFVVLFYLQRVYIKNGFESLSYKHFASAMFWIGIGVLGLGIYHLFANWMILGNPLAFLSSISSIDPANGPWDYDPDQILALRLLYPFVATFYNSAQTLGNISPMFVAFLPALFRKDIRKEINISKQMWILSSIAVAALLLWIFSFFTLYEIRYVLFLWAILFMPLAEIIATILNDKDHLFQNILAGLIITLLAFNVLRTIYISVDRYAPVDEHGTPQCFCQSLNTINAAASPGDRALTLTGYRYYLRPDLFACSTKHVEYRKLRDAAKVDDEAFWLEVYREGYKYIVYENHYATSHLQIGTIPSPEGAPSWLELESIFGSPGDQLAVYRIHIIDPPSNTKAVCQVNTSGIWEVQYTK
jgi:hypothetical protein